MDHALAGYATLGSHIIEHTQTEQFHNKRCQPVVKKALVVMGPCHGAELDKLQFVLKLVGGTICPHGHDLDPCPVRPAAAQAVAHHAPIIAELNVLEERREVKESEQGGKVVNKRMRGKVIGGVRG